MAYRSPMRACRAWIHRLSGAAVLLIMGCSGGGGGGGGGGGSESEAAVEVDGVAAATTAQTSGLDATGTSYVILSGADFSVEIRFPGSGPGSFASTATDGGLVFYSDADNNTSIASDTQAGSSYQIDVTAYTSSGIEGTFTATVVGPGGATHTLSGSFKLVFAGLSASDPYGGTYIGILRARGQIQVGTDPMTFEPIWGPLQTLGLRVTLHFDHLATVDGAAVYDIDHASVDDALFGCTVDGCTPVAADSAAVFPATPGTPAPSGPSAAGQGFHVFFPNGSAIDTLAGAGELYTSLDARVMGNALGIEQPWWSQDSSLDDYLLIRFGDTYANLNPTTRDMSWSMTKSAL